MFRGRPLRTSAYEKREWVWQCIKYWKSAEKGEEGRIFSKNRRRSLWTAPKIIIIPFQYHISKEFSTMSPSYIKSTQALLKYNEFYFNFLLPLWLRAVYSNP